jgi:hypothetical protein
VKNVWKLVGIILVIAALAGCSAAELLQPASSTGTDTSTDVSAAVPPVGPQGGLDGVNRLALGTLELEGTGDAVTAAQAAALLPLWQVIQGGSLKSEAETEAVLRQIEAKMTESQLAAIEAMGLTFEDTQAWMQEQGIELPARPEGQGGPGVFQDLSEEERAQMREQMQSVSPEERATRMAEMGIQRPGGAEGGAPNPGAFGGGTRGAICSLSR